MVKVLQTIHLPHTIVPSTASWSPDGQMLAISTQKGVLVMEFLPKFAMTSSSKLHIEKFLLPRIEKANPITSLLYRGTNKPKESVKRNFDDAFHVPTSENFGVVNKMSWMSPNQLLTLTEDHWLRLFELKGHVWVEMADLSKILHENFAKKKFKKKEEKMKFFFFTSVLCLNDHAILAGNKLGNVFVYKLVDKTCKIVMENSFFDSQLGSPVQSLYDHQINSSQTLLFVCCSDGRIKTLLLEQDQMKDLGLLWKNPDRISIRQILVLKDESNSLVVLVVKGRHTIVVKFDVQESFESQILKFGSHITSNVISLSKHNQDLCYVIGYETEPPKLLQFKDNTFRDWTLKEVPVKEFDQKTHKLVDSKVTKNQEIHIFAQNIRVPNDHLVLRMPSQLTFFTFQALENLETAKGNKVQMNNNRGILQYIA